jgi:hypothetical protein
MDLDERSSGLIQVPSQNLPAETEECFYSLSQDGQCPAEIRTDHFPDTTVHQFSTCTTYITVLNTTFIFCLIYNLSCYEMFQPYMWILLKLFHCMLYFVSHA